MELILNFIYAAAVLLFGTYFTIVFSGVILNKKNIVIGSVFFIVSAIIQASTYIILDESMVWKLYPFIVHTPLIILITAVFRKKLITVLSATFTAYLCCQPAKWFALLALELSGSMTVQYLVRILILALSAILIYRYFASYMSQLFNKDAKSVSIFCMIPAIYYLFDYATVVYIDLWINNEPLVNEFMAFFLCIVFVLFCLVYYKEYETKADALRKEQIISISIRQQEKELESLKHREQDLRILQHDMRHLLNYISNCLDNEDIKSAKIMIDGFITNIENTSVARYCDNQTINYIVSHYYDICKESNIEFVPEITVSDISVDDTIFFSILSNALDNAVKAQNHLPVNDRRLYIMLKESGNKLLLMIKNPCAKIPEFIDGIPVSDKLNHGYGTQSIRHMTEILGGNCQFKVEDKHFILRVII